MTIFSQFLRKKASFIPVDPVQLEARKFDVFEYPNEAVAALPPKAKIVKVERNSSRFVKPVPAPVARKVLPRNLTGNVRDTNKLNQPAEEKKNSSIETKFPVESKPIEQGRPKRTGTRSGAKIVVVTKLPETKDIKLSKLSVTKLAKLPEAKDTKLPEAKDTKLPVSEPAKPSEQAATPVKRTSARIIVTGTSSKPELPPQQQQHQPAISFKVKRSFSTIRPPRPIRTKEAKNQTQTTEVMDDDENDDEFEIEVSDDSEDESGCESDSELELEPESSKKGRRPFPKRSKRSWPSKSKSKPASSSKSSRWERIKQVLKSGGTIEALPGRTDEFDWIKRTVLGLLESALGGCLYISGVPGTGKTATTHRTLDSLSLSALKGKCPDFDFVEINGMRLSDPGQAYSILARSIFKKKVPTTGALALKMLEAHFKDQQKSKQAGRPCVVLLDELDLLLRKRQSLLYHFFEWPNWTNSQLIVITIANTMDLPERFLSNRISSRLGLTRYNFKPYDHAALSNIIEHQLKDYVKYLGKDAIQLCARKVSAVSGDARRAVNLAKRAVDYFRSATQEELQARITGRQVSEKVPEASQLSAVNLRLMDIILKEALMANPVEIIGKLSKHQRIMLLSIILSRKRAEEEVSIRGGTKIIGKTGNNNNNVILTVNRVLDQHFQLCRTHQYHPLPSLQELYILLESLESLRLLRCLKFRESGPESVIQLLVHEEDIRKGLGDDQSLKKYIRE